LQSDVFDHLISACCKPNASSGMLRSLLKQTWLTSNKTISLAWIRYQAFLQQRAISRKPGIFSLEHHSAISALNSFGYYIFKEKISPNILKKLTDLCLTCRLSPELSDQRVASGAMLSRNNATLDTSHSRFFYPPSVLGSDLVKLIATEPSLLSIVSEYLHASSISIKVNGWLSVGRPNLTRNKLSSNAQLFHLDLDAFRFLKVFIYITDVSSENGPHVYVSGSSHPYQNHSQVLSMLDSSLRIKDADILSLYGQSSLRKHMGKAGTVIIEDTSGFHKGSPLVTGASRDLISFVFESGQFNNF